jgi:uncharacterized protein YlxW (UPF0749 family)
MSFWTAAVLIVLISAIAGVMRSRSRAEHKIIRERDGTERPAVSQREQELQSEVVDLRERIKVLERIATDANSTGSREAKAIADEIEQLRDQ